MGVYTALAYPSAPLVLSMVVGDEILQQFEFVSMRSVGWLGFSCWCPLPSHPVLRLTTSPLAYAVVGGTSNRPAGILNTVRPSVGMRCFVRFESIAGLQYFERIASPRCLLAGCVDVFHQQVRAEHLRSALEERAVGRLKTKRFTFSVGV